MFILQAPYPSVKTTLLLPSPRMGNTRNLQSTVQTLRMMDGTLYTYKKSKRGRKVHRWDFLVSSDKAMEMKAFMDSYQGNLMHATDHENVRHFGYMVLNPIEAVGEGRAENWPGGEAYQATIQFEEQV